METTVKAFLLALAAAGRSPRTITWYADKLGQVSSILGRSPPPPIREITTHDLRRAIVVVRERGISPYTADGYIRCLRRFFSWAVREDILDRNPAERLERPGLPDCIPKGVTVAEVRLLLQATLCQRDRALILMLFSTGCRAGEVVGLRVADVDEGVATVRGKGGKPRAVAFDEFTHEAVRDYLAGEHPGGEHLWMGAKGPLTVSGLTQVVKRLKKRASITRQWGLHAFRHGFARLYLLNGGDLASLSQILGHSDSGVTVRFYARFTRSELLDRQRRLSPVRLL